MKYGDKQVRYAVIEKDGHLREVKKTFYESTTGVDHQTKQPKSLVKIKNNGSTANDIKITGIQTKGSFIVKNDTSHYVSDFGWVNTEEVSPNDSKATIYTSEVSIPNDETIATHGLTSNKLENIVNGTNGQFEVTDWSNCKDAELGSAFRSATCIKKVPPEWPKNNITSLYRTLAGITIDTIPNWTNTTNVTDIREMLNGTTINEDLKIDGMIGSLTSVTKVKKLFNNCTINKYSYTGGDYKFYSLYTALAKHDGITGYTAACFGGVQYDDKKDIYTDSYNYAVRFKYTGSDGQTANVIPPDLMYIPKEWGGFAHRAYSYVTIDDDTFTDTGLLISDSHINWGLEKDYNTLKSDNGTWIITDHRDFYTSVRIAVECIREDTGETLYVFGTGNVNNITWPMVLDTSLSTTIKIHVYINKPDSVTPPKLENNAIVTDWLECFLTETITIPDPDDPTKTKTIPNPYRGEDGVYTRTGLYPTASTYDITQCTITVNTPSQGASAVTWEVRTADGIRIDDSSRPPDKYEVILTKVGDSSIQYKYGTNSEHLITSASIPLYSIESGVCIDANGNEVTNIPDGSYQVNVKAFKNDAYCEKNATKDIRNWDTFSADTHEARITTDAENLTWTVKIYRKDTGEDVTSSLADGKSMYVWIYKKSEKYTAFWIPSAGRELYDNNIIKLKNVTSEPGKYTMNLTQITAKNGSQIGGSSSLSDALVIEDERAIKADFVTASIDGIFWDNSDSADFEFYTEDEIDLSTMNIGFGNCTSKPSGTLQDQTIEALGNVASSYVSESTTTLVFTIDDEPVEKTVYKYSVNKTYNGTKYNMFCIGYNGWDDVKFKLLILNLGNDNISYSSSNSQNFQTQQLGVPGTQTIYGWITFTTIGTPYRG